MLTKARLIKMLFDYRQTCTRIDVLAFRIKKIEQAQNVGSDAGIAGAQLASVQVTDMPTSHSSISNPTERVAFLLDRLSAEKRIELKRIVGELETLITIKQQLDIMLGSLKEKERFVIVAHLVDDMTWRETVRAYTKEFGTELTEGALKYKQTQGLDRMIEVARELEED